MLAAMDGPIPKANNTVPIPRLPPKDHPRQIAVSSMALRTHAIGKSVTRCNPVINPSLGPGPRFEIK